MKQRKNRALAALCLLVVCIHLVTVLTGSQYYLTQLTMAAYYGLVIIGLGTLMGYAGQISIGHAGFFAIGGYLSAALTTRNLASFQGDWPVRWLDALKMLKTTQDLSGDQLLTVAPWAACLCAVAAAALIALIIGIPVLKLKGHYLAMATWALALLSIESCWLPPISARPTAFPRFPDSPSCRPWAVWARS